MSATLNTRFLRRRGVTLTELMIAVSVLTIGVIGGMGAFKHIGRSMTQSRLKTIATNLAQEKMEVLRNKSYFQLLVTTATAMSSGYSPDFPYDTAAYPPEVITLWGMPALTRVVNVDYVSLSGSVASPLPYSSDDPGMKKITVTVMWNDGGTPRKIQLASYYENPGVEVLSAGFSGSVIRVPDGAPVGGALVQVVGSPKWRAFSGSSGNYSFQVAPGTYTLVCSSSAYFSSASNTLSVTAGFYTQQDFFLTKIATGSVSGMAYMRDHLVLSQVVGSSAASDGFFREWVEVYNPTTWTWTMASGLDSGTVGLVYQLRGQPPQLLDFKYLSFSVPPHGYYLFANNSQVQAAGVLRTADAVYAPSMAGYPNVIKINTDPGNAAAGLALVRLPSLERLDSAGWGTGGLAPEIFEGTPIEQTVGLEAGEEYVRRSNPAGVAAGAGRAYDSNNNDADFKVFSSVVYGPKNSTLTEPPQTGTPASGAIVTANDGLSSQVLVSATGFFSLTSVATGTVQNSASAWVVTVASYNVFNSSSGVAVAAGQNSDVGDIILSTTVLGGIVTGRVYGSGQDYYRPLGTPSIRVGSGGAAVNTDSGGFYMLFLGTGAAVITANYGNANGAYQSADEEVLVNPGVITAAPDFHIAQGGYLTGYVTSGTGALPNIVVQATNGGPVFEDTTDATGHFYIYAATSSVPYSAAPVLDPLQSYTGQPGTPLISSITAPGSIVFAGTITVVGAMGTITGSVTRAGSPITTGVLVVASTAPVNDPPPTVIAAISASQTTLYSVSSQADGTYSLAVRAGTGTVYNVRAFYPVVDTASGVVTYTSQSASAVPVSAGVATVRNFSW